MVIVSSTSAPLIVVVGATGNQGGSVVRHISLSKKEYRLRAFTRDVSKAPAQDLAKLGAEVRAVELGAGKVQQIADAFEGADIVFGVSIAMDNEVANGKALVDGAKKAGVKLFVWGGLPSYSKISGGEVTDVNIFDDKAAVTEYARTELGAANVIDVQPPGFFSNFFTMHRPMKQGDGTYQVALPIDGDAPAYWLDTQRDLGAYTVAAIEMSPEERPQEVRAASDKLSFNELVKLISQASGKTVTFQRLLADVYTGILTNFMPESGAKAVTGMYAVIDRYGYYGEKKPTTLAELKSNYKPRLGKQWAEEADYSSLLV